MSKTGDELVYRMHREAAERLHDQPLPPVKRQTIPYTQLAEAKPGDYFFLEWNTYRREVGQLLAEGHEGKWVLIKDQTVVGLYDPMDAARAEGRKRFSRDRFLVEQVQAERPVYRIRGYC
jgi:hypothetical protein